MASSLVQGLLLRRSRRFFPSSGHNRCQYSLCIPMEGWPGWVGLNSKMQMVSHLSTNPAWCRLMSLMRPTMVHSTKLPCSCHWTFIANLPPTDQFQCIVRSIIFVPEKKLPTVLSRGVEYCCAACFGWFCLSRSTRRREFLYVFRGSCVSGMTSP